ncbi:MAG: integrase [Candidatus Hadarchaeum sp.]
MRVDLQLKPLTIKVHVLRVKKFLEFLNGDLESLNDVTIRKYLSLLTGFNPATYSNVVKSLRRFVRDFLGKQELMKTFRLPYLGFRSKPIPTKEQIREGYYALRTPKQKLIYLLYAVTGLRESELKELKLTDIDLQNRCIRARHDSLTKRAFCTFWNSEVDVLLREYLDRHKDEIIENGGRIFRFSWSSLRRMRELVERKTGGRITPRVLRKWFCNEMLSKGIQEVYVDAFCGRVPKSILARHYTDFSPERLKEIYDKAELKILS